MGTAQRDAGRSGCIFVSYRRGDGGYTVSLADRLRARFGDERVFVDVNEIHPGRDFTKEISGHLESSSAVVAIIGPDWLRRLSDLEKADDWVRRELATTLLREGGYVLPVLFNDAEMPAQEKLPPDLRALATRQFIRVWHATFDADARRVCQAIEEYGVARRDVSRISWTLALASVTIALALLLAFRTLAPLRAPDDATAFVAAGVLGATAWLAGYLRVPIVRPVARRAAPLTVKFGLVYVASSLALAFAYHGMRPLVVSTTGHAETDMYPCHSIYHVSNFQATCGPDQWTMPCEKKQIAIPCETAFANSHQTVKVRSGWLDPPSARRIELYARDARLSVVLAPLAVEFDDQTSDAPQALPLLLPTDPTPSMSSELVSCFTIRSVRPGNIYVLAKLIVNDKEVAHDGVWAPVPQKID